jgi:hypothetical protein
MRCVLGAEFGAGSLLVPLLGAGGAVFDMKEFWGFGRRVY